jgi:nucleoid DNA-binding protein
MKRPASRQGTPYRRLLALVADTEGLTRATTTAVVERFVAELPSVVWGQGRLVVPGLASFRVRSRKARNIANPVTGEPMRLERRRVVAARVVRAWRSR